MYNTYTKTKYKILYTIQLYNLYLDVKYVI